MPTIFGLQGSTVGDANTAFALAFFPRYVSDRFFTKLCGTTKSSRPVEPFALDGSAPLLRKFSGGVVDQDTNSWTLNVPNLLFKNMENIARRELEFSQTRAITKRFAQHGVRIAQHPAFLLAKRMMQGAVANSQKQTFEGQTYTVTYDAQPVYSASHNHNGSNQTNIIQGHLPNTAAGVANQEIATTAQQLYQDVTALIDAICGVKDDKNVPMFPDFDAEQSLTIVVPPILKTAADLAFKKPGALIGGVGAGSGGSGSTTAPVTVKDVLAPGFLRGGIPDIESDDPTATVSPVNPTDWYAVISDDFLKPWYWQRFRPKQEGETVPLGENPEAQAEKMLKAADAGNFNVPVEALDVYAATEIDTNVGQLGDRATRDVVERERFFVSARCRGNVIPGLWPLNWRVIPVGGS